MKIKSMMREYLDGTIESYSVETTENLEYIKYHTPAGNGDAHYCDIKIKGNDLHRVFKPDNVDFLSENIGIFKGKDIETNEYVYGEYSTCDEPGDNGLNGHQFRETNTKLHYIKDVYSKFHIVYPESIEKGE